MMNGKTQISQKMKTFGLLSMFGVLETGMLPKLDARTTSSNRKQPQAVQDFLIQRAKEKRARRAAKKALQLSTIAR